MTKMWVDHSLSAEALREGRIALGWTQREMARLLNQAPGTYSACENGRRRFPLQRLQFLPRELAMRVRDALVEEFALDLDRRMEASKPILRRRRRMPKPLAAEEAAALD